MKKLLLFATMLCGSFASQSQITALPINPGFDEDPKSFVNFGTYTYFVAYNNNSGIELWRSDGTPSGTVLAVDINPTGSALSNGNATSTLCVFNNNLYFFANDGVHGFELWKSDGTPSGTAMVKDIYPGSSGSSTTFKLKANNSALYFYAMDSIGAAHSGLWTSDGTSAGTTMLLAASSTSYEIFPDNNLVYFDANVAGTGDEFYVSDGTVGGTHIVKDINSGTASSSPKNFVKFGSNILFSAKGPNGLELYISDGTSGGTNELKDINPYGDSKPCGFTNFNSKVLFFANDSTHGQELWITDGTLGGTQLLKDIVVGSGSGGSLYSSPAFVVFNGKAFFTTALSKLSYTDGTAAGTAEFMSAYTQPIFNFIPNMGRLYFVARNGSGQEIWSTSTGLDTTRHTFTGTPINTFPITFLGTNNIIYLVLKNVFADKNLYKLDLNFCSPAATISGNVPLTCNQNGITLSTGGYDSYSWSTGATTQQINVSSAGSYTVNVQDNTFGCTSSATVVVTFQGTIATPEICGVTVDSVSQRNLILWNKNTNNISETYFRIEKEVGTNQFALVADWPYDSLSAFLDTSSNPAVTSFRYRLSLLDSCGNVSTPGTVHETIHLSQNVGINGEVNLIWNSYQGTGYSQLNVKRSLNGNAWTNLAVVPGNVLSYSDLTPPLGALRYQIEVLIDSTCIPTRSLFSLFSNTLNYQNEITGMDEGNSTNISLFPNPVSLTLQIQIPNSLKGGNLTITDITGRTVRTVPVSSTILVEDVSELAKGMYVVRYGSEGINPQYFLKQ